MPMTSRTDPDVRLAYGALLTTLVLWASAFVAIRHLGNDFRPGALALARQGVAVMALGTAALIRGFRRPARGDWPAIVVIGLLWFAVYHVALNEAERRIDAGTAAMLLQVSPMLITLLAIVFLGERMTAPLAVGLLVAFAGVLVIGLATSEGGEGDLIGVVLCLVSCGSYATSVILQKPLLARCSALDLTLLSAAIGFAATLPFAGQLVDDATASPTSDLWWVVYLGLLPTALAFTTWSFALRHLPASTMGVSTYLVPPITVAIAWVLLGETPPPLAYLGGLLCLLGVWWARRPSRTKPADPALVQAPQR